MKKVYLDFAATTFVSSEVLNEMMPCFNAIYGNSSSLHSFGRDAAAIVDRARDRIAAAINAKNANEIYFTSGGCEANTMAMAAALCPPSSKCLCTRSVRSEGFSAS